MALIDKIVLGTAQFGLPYGINNKSGQPGESEVLEILDRAHRSGVKYLDTAEDYGSAHALIGKYHEKHASRTFGIISKVSAKVSTPKLLQDNLDKALSDMRISSLEGYLFHKFSNYKKYPALTRELISLRGIGKVKKIGVSIYTNTELEEVIELPEVEIIQLPLNLLDNVSRKRDLLERAKLNGKEIHARSIYLQGLFFMDMAQVPNGLSDLVPGLAAVKRLAIDSGVHVESLALNYVIRNKLIDKVLFGVDTLDHLNKSLECLKEPVDLSVLEEVDRISMVETDMLNPTNWT